jgi:hypothetical protein
LHSTSGSISPSGKVIDMAYAAEGTLAFKNVVVPSAGLYTIDWRYACASGLFGGVTNRHMGPMVNGVIVTTTQRFTITGSFSTYQHSALQVQLNAGPNAVIQLAVTDHGISRVDQMTVTPASVSVPATPTALSAMTSLGKVTLTWMGSNGVGAYQVYRGTKSDGEALTPIASTGASMTTFVDLGAASGKTYFYNVSTTNGVGVSVDSNEITVIAN